ncbi:MAG TPA: FAD-dependent oxidoreductase [Anaeromyxobacteraceae bacterium]|nr:FAD-dependent oxidoreductase [Anaeromyxobacteraceae bacterium]
MVAPSPHRTEVVVVGAGMAGTSVAAELAPRRRTVLLEMEEHPAYHATGRSAAVFSEGYGNAVVRALTRASRPFLEEPPPGFTDEPLLLPRGWMFVARPDQLEYLGRIEQEIASTGGRLRALDPAEATARVPILRRDYLAGALWDATAMDVDVHALHQGFLRRLRAAGGELVTSARVLALERARGAWRVETEQGAFEAPLLVDAAGAWADEVGRLAGAVPVGLQPMRRTVVLLDLPGGVAAAHWPLVIDAEEQFYFKPESGKLLASPADETPSAPCDARPDDLDVAIAVDRVVRACDLEVQHVARRWAGLRSFVADRTPVVGPDPRAEGFVWLAAQGGAGIQTSPALARVAAALALGEPVPADIARQGVSARDLSPARLAGAGGVPWGGAGG